MQQRILPFLLFSGTASTVIRADGSPSYSMACMVNGAVLNGILLAGPISDGLAAILFIVMVTINFRGLAKLHQERTL